METSHLGATAVAGATPARPYPSRGTLPRKVRARELVARNARLHGVIALDECVRLSALVSGDGSSDVAVDLEFAPNGADQPACTGTVAVALMLECQRCLEPVLTQVSGAVRAEFVTGEAEARAEGFEGVSLDEEAFLLSTFVEDEVLLALPFAPVHDEEDCAMAAGDDYAAEPPADADARVKPFAQLRDLLDRNSS